MAWQSKTLKTIVPAAFTAASEVKAAAEGALAKLNGAMTAVQQKLNEANSALSLLQQDLDELEVTGFAIIALSPKQGSWSSRLVMAPNAPSTESGLYSCGCFNIASMTTEEAARLAYRAMLKALTEKMEIELVEPKIRGWEPKKEIDPEIRPDEWKGITLGEMMPGVLNTARNAWNVQKAIVQNVQGMKDRVEKKIQDYADALSKANALISALGTSGLYQYMMEPGLGSWITRAASEEGAPSTISTQYSFGFAAVAVAADLGGCQQLYAKLQAVM